MKEGYNVVEAVGKSTSNQYSALRKCIDTMLSRHCKEYKAIYKAVLPKSFDNVSYNQANSHAFVSAVCHYLRNTATCYYKEK
eukprot:11561646-Ditylum_brightwellii.AAC.1